MTSAGDDPTCFVLYSLKSTAGPTPQEVRELLGRD
jgi:hypothetical protein